VRARSVAVGLEKSPNIKAAVGDLGQWTNVRSSKIA